MSVAPNIFNVHNVFDLIFASRNNVLSDGTHLSGSYMDRRVRLNVIIERACTLVVGSIGNAAIILAHIDEKWLVFLHNDSYTLPPAATRKQRLKYFHSIFSARDQGMEVCESNDYQEFSRIVSHLARKAR